MTDLYDGKPHVVGNAIYQKCGWCDQLVKMNKFIFGSTHLCSQERVDYEKRH